MAKLKGKKQLNSAVLKEFSSFGITSAKLTGEYAYLPANFGLTFGLELPTEYEWLIEFIQDRFNYTCDNPFLLLFLHEIGHHQTIAYISYGVQKFCDEEKNRIEVAMEFAEDIEEMKKLEFQYFNLPDELMATQWAVNYAKEHPRKTKNMANRLVQSFQKFYKINGITEDD